MNVLKIAFVICVFVSLELFFGIEINAQNSTINSLIKQIENSNSSDTAKVNALNKVGSLIYEQDPIKAKKYAEDALIISHKINYMQGIAMSERLMGLVHVAKDKKIAFDYFSTALKYAQKSGDKEVECICLISLGAAYFKLGNYTESEELNNKAYKIANDINNKSLIAKALFNLALNTSTKDNLSLAIEKFQEVIDLAHQINDKKMIISVYGEIATIHARKGNYPAAIEAYLSSLKINEDEGYKMGAFRVLNNMAGVYTEQRDFESAVKSIQRALDISKEMGDSIRMSICFANIGSIYSDLKKPEASDYLHKSLELGKDKNIPLKINVLTNLGSIYTSQNEFDKAKIYIDEALKLADVLKSIYISSEVWERTGYYYTKKRQYAKAKEYTEKALSAAKEVGYLKLQSACCKQLAEIYAATYDYNNAYLKHVEYKVLSDSLLNEGNIREISRLESTYHFDKERKVYEMEKDKQALKIAKQWQFILLLSIIFILLIGFIFILQRSYKLKHQVLSLEVINANRELEDNQKSLTTATLKLMQSAENETHSLKTLSNIKDTDNVDAMNEIRSLISQYKLKSVNVNWEEFEILFKKIDSSFYNRLNNNFPNLTPNERKLCVFLRLNMSNSQIVQITLQSEEALKKSRLRLRKKLGITREINLAAFIHSI